MKLFANTVLLLLFVCPLSALFSCTAHAAQKPIPVKEVFDISYYTGSDADDKKHKLNLFIPEGVEQPPVMIWIHGGAWAVGDRKDETTLARHFAKAGIAVAVISYRLSPALWISPKLNSGIQHPEHIKDVARAFAWVYDNADTYQYDKQSIFVSGYSAGAHLSALLAADPSYLKAVGRDIKEVKAAIPIAGAYDMEAYYKAHIIESGQKMADQHVKGVFGETMSQLQQASPTTYIDNKWIPMLVLSETDTYDYTRLYEDLAKKKGNDSIEFFHVRDKNHKGLFVDLAQAEQSEHRDRIVDYIMRHRAK